jgi:hypothetical protein
VIRKVNFGLPRAPAGLTAALGPLHVVDVSFTHNGLRDPSKWILWRRIPGATGWDSVRTMSGLSVRTVRDSLFDVKVAAYAWSVTACNTVGCSPRSDSVLFASRMAPPSDVTLGDAHAGNTVIEWTGDDDAAFFIVRRIGPNPTTFQTNHHYYTDTTSEAGVRYFYSVTAWAAIPRERHTDPSAQLSVTPTP